MKLYVYQLDSDGQMRWLPVEVPAHIGLYLLWCGCNVVKALC